MAKYMLFDTETTGNQEEDRIIQIGAMLIHSRDTIETFDALCFSDTPIKIEAMEIHNITPQLLGGKPLFVQTPFWEVLNQNNTPQNYLIAHNIQFDLGMLVKEGFVNHYQLIDTLRCAKHLLPNSPYHRLQYLRYSLGLYRKEAKEAAKHNITIKAHDALGDVLVMKLLLSQLFLLVKEQFEGVEIMPKLVELTHTPVLMREFKFGKYKGEQIEEIARRDSGYLAWMLKNLELDEDMKYTLKQYL